MLDSETSPRTWVLQIRRGELLLVQDLGEIKRLIAERRIDPEALLYEVANSRSVRSLPEFADLFDPRAKQSAASEVASGDRAGDDRAPFPIEEVPYLDSISPLGATEDAFGDDYEPVQRRTPIIFAAAAALVLVGAGGYFALRHPSPPAPMAAIAIAPTLVSPPSKAIAPAQELPPPVAPATAPTPAAATPSAIPIEPPAPPTQARAAPAPTTAVEVAATRSAPATPGETPVQGGARPAQRTYDDLVRKGDEQLEKGHSKRAMELFEEASRIRPEGAEALAGMAYGWLDRGDAQRAIPLFMRALEQNDSLAPALFGLGTAYREQGRRNEALETFRRYLARFPGQQEANAARHQIEQLSAREVRK
jgi:tetratricopeptide (TPR) repeat protein